MAVTYAQLTQLVQDYLSDAETSMVANIDRFIRVTEDRIFYLIQIPDQRAQTTLTTGANQSTLNTPTGFMAVHSMAVENGANWDLLLPKQVNFMDQFNPSRSTGIPVYYALKDASTILLSPTPNGAYSVNLEYYKKPQSIVDSGTTSWLGDNAENALLYGTLVEAYTYLKGEPDLIQLYQSRMDEAIQGLIELGLGKNRRDNFRNAETRVNSK